MVQSRTGKTVVGIFIREILGLEKQPPFHKALDVGPGRYMGMVGVELPMEKFSGDELVGLYIGEGINIAGV
jgi:hypothetical protein